MHYPFKVSVGKCTCFHQRTKPEETSCLDISYTAGPRSLQKVPGYEHDPHAHFWRIASLLYSPGRENNLAEPQPSELHGAMLPPDEHLACFDYLYYVCADTVSCLAPLLLYFSTALQQSFEYGYELSPAWRFVVKHFRWTHRLQAIADGYLRRVFRVPYHEPIPPVSTSCFRVVTDRFSDYSNIDQVYFHSCP